MPTDGAHPTGMDIDSKGTIWIAYRDASKIAAITPSGGFVVTVGTLAVALP